ncbi:MAG: M56 family metallopeptidase [Pseudobdellovibrio sp.]
MTAQQSLNVLLAASSVSLVFSFIYWLQEQLSVSSRQQLKFLKTYLVVSLAAPAISALVIVSHTGVAIGRLLPAQEILKRNIKLPSDGIMRILPNENITISHVMLTLYIIGFSIIFFRLMSSYFKMRTILLDSSASEISGRKVRLSSSIKSPFSFGFFNPQIFVPASFVAERSVEVNEIMVTHEETHIKNFDPQIKLFSLIVKALVFFNPFAYYLHRKIELETEIECDSQTMQKTEISYQKYGALLIDTVELLQLGNSTPLFSYMSNTNLRRRIQAMKATTFRKPVLGTILGAFVFVASLTAIAASSGITANTKNAYHVTAEIAIDGKVVSSPQFTVIEDEAAKLEVKNEKPFSALRMSLKASHSDTQEVSDGIDLKMTIEYKSDNTAFRSNPYLRLVPNHEGTVVLKSDASGTLTMKVVAERI